MRRVCRTCVPECVACGFRMELPGWDPLSGSDQYGRRRPAACCLPGTMCPGAPVLPWIFRRRTSIPPAESIEPGDDFIRTACSYWLRLFETRPRMSKASCCKQRLCAVTIPLARAMTVRCSMAALTSSTRNSAAEILRARRRARLTVPAKLAASATAWLLKSPVAGLRISGPPRLLRPDPTEHPVRCGTPWRPVPACTQSSGDLSDISASCAGRPVCSASRPGPSPRRYPTPSRRIAASLLPAIMAGRLCRRRVTAQSIRAPVAAVPIQSPKQDTH